MRHPLTFIVASVVGYIKLPKILQGIWIPSSSHQITHILPYIISMIRKDRWDEPTNVKCAPLFQILVSEDGNVIVFL